MPAAVSRRAAGPARKRPFFGAPRGGAAASLASALGGVALGVSGAAPGFSLAARSAVAGRRRIASRSPFRRGRMDGGGCEDGRRRRVLFCSAFPRRASDRPGPLSGPPERTGRRRDHRRGDRLRFDDVRSRRRRFLPLRARRFCRRAVFRGLAPLFRLGLRLLRPVRYTGLIGSCATAKGRSPPQRT